MKRKALIITLLVFSLFSCEFRKSVHKDLITGLATKGNGLSCDDVYLSTEEGKIQRNTFTYGEKIYLNFENIDGFKKVKGYAFPGLNLVVSQEPGDTVLIYNDLYADDVDGMKISPLLLTPYLTVANPVHSQRLYKLYVKIWDKNGPGIFSANMDFNVIPNPHIKVESKNVSFDEIYLFSKERDKTITDDRAMFNENIYMMFEGLEGFKEETGQVYIGLALQLKDSEGRLILDEKDLIGESGMEVSALKSQVAPTFIFSGSRIKNPVSCDITIWDKKSDNRIRASMLLNVE